MAKSLDRLIRLARKTGDRLIIHDPQEKRDIVIMDLDQYEILVDAAADLEEYVGEFEAYEQSQSQPVNQTSSPEDTLPSEDEPPIPFSSEPEHISYPVPERDLQSAKSVQPVGNWTPASSLLEEKYRALTGQSQAKPDAEPRRVPMINHNEIEQEFDEDDDEPVFLEEPV